MKFVEIIPKCRYKDLKPRGSVVLSCLALGGLVQGIPIVEGDTRWAPFADRYKWSDMGPL